MSRYVALLDHDGKAFGVAFPDAPGCTAMGESRDEALHNAREALAEWANDLVADAVAVPAPRRIDELLADEEVRYAIMAGAALAVVPLRESGSLYRL